MERRSSRLTQDNTENQQPKVKTTIKRQRVAKETKEEREKRLQEMKEKEERERKNFEPTVNKCYDILIKFLESPTLEALDDNKDVEFVLFKKVWWAYTNTVSYYVNRFSYSNNTFDKNSFSWKTDLMMLREALLTVLQNTFSNSDIFSILFKGECNRIKKLFDKIYGENTSLSKTMLNSTIDKLRKYIFEKYTQEFFVFDDTSDEVYNTESKLYKQTYFTFMAFQKLFDLSFTYESDVPEKNFIYITEKEEIFYRGISNRNISAIQDTEKNKSFLSVTKDMEVALTHILDKPNPLKQINTIEESIPSDYIEILKIQPGIRMANLNVFGEKADEWQKEYVLPRGLTITTSPYLEQEVFSTPSILESSASVYIPKGTTKTIYKLERVVSTQENPTNVFGIGGNKKSLKRYRRKNTSKRYRRKTTLKRYRRKRY